MMASAPGPSNMAPVRVTRSLVCRTCMTSLEDNEALNLTQVGPDKENLSKQIQHYFGVQLNATNIHICRTCLRHVINWASLRKNCLIKQMIGKYFSFEMQGLRKLPQAALADFHTELSVRLTNSAPELFTTSSLEPYAKACMERILRAYSTSIAGPSSSSVVDDSLHSIAGPSSISSSSIVSGHGHHCFHNTPPNPYVGNLKPIILNSTLDASYNCGFCDKNFVTLNNYVEHVKEHNQLFHLKDSGILLCPLCDKNYAKSDYNWHVKTCTDSMKLEENYYGCIYCQSKLKVAAPNRFRIHFIFCKSFETLKDVYGENYYKCINCNFQHYTLFIAYKHANGYCIYFQLKMKYAMSINEKKMVEEKNLAISKYSKIGLKTLISTNRHLNPTFCNPNRQKLLGCFDYLCHFCNRRFYSELIFKKHLHISRIQCRLPPFEYCKICVCNFNSIKELSLHLNKTEPSTCDEINDQNYENLGNSVQPPGTIDVIVIDE